MKKIPFLVLAAILPMSIISCSDNNDTPDVDEDAYYSGDSYGELNSPYIHYSTELPKLHETTWSCFLYGSYPQAEVVEGSFNAVEDYAIKDGDIITDAQLYAQLEDATWTDDETTIGQDRYRRLKGSEVTHYETNSSGHYKWTDKETYHYFKYQPVRWRVLNISGSTAIAISNRAFDCKRFNDTDTTVTWQTCTLREWLNSDAVDMLFTDTEKACVPEAAVENLKNHYFGTDCGPTTYDRLYVLSESEVFSMQTAKDYGFYMGDGIDDPARRFKPTMWAMAKGCWIANAEGYLGNTFWFMRSSGYTPYNVTYICEFGYIYNRGTLVFCDDAGIVPVMRIDLSKADYTPDGTVSSNDIIQ